MCWRTKALLAIGACAGLAAVYYGLRGLPVFLRKKEEKNKMKKRTSVEVVPEMDDNIFEGKSSMFKSVSEVSVHEKDDGVSQGTSSVIEDVSVVRIHELDMSISQGLYKVCEDDSEADTSSMDDNASESMSSVCKGDSEVDASGMDDETSDQMSSMCEEDLEVDAPDTDDDDSEGMSSMCELDLEVDVPDTDDDDSEGMSSMCEEDSEVDASDTDVDASEGTSSVGEDGSEPDTSGTDNDDSEGSSGVYDVGLQEHEMEDDEDEGEFCVFDEIPELKERYEVYKTIGSGAFGTVKLGMRVGSEEPVAIKSLEKKELGGDLSDVRREIEALQNLRHQHVCQLHEAFETTGQIYLVLEFCPRGDLLEYIVASDGLSEEEARRIFRQIVSALAYIHSQGYAHRDLKPENMMLDESNNIKLIDFGLCAKPEGGLGTALTTYCGTPCYMAPEVIEGRNYLGAEADVWSLGVVLYSMLCNQLPFEGGYDDEHLSTLREQISSGHFYVPERMSPAAELLIRLMLEVEPECRITVKQLLRQPWVMKGYKGPVEWNTLPRQGSKTETHPESMAVRCPANMPTQDSPTQIQSR